MIEQIKSFSTQITSDKKEYVIIVLTGEEKYTVITDNKYTDEARRVETLGAPVLGTDSGP